MQYPLLQQAEAICRGGDHALLIELFDSAHEADAIDIQVCGELREVCVEFKFLFARALLDVCEIRHELVHGAFLHEDIDMRGKDLHLACREEKEVVDDLRMMRAEVMTGLDDMVISNENNFAVGICFNNIFKIGHGQIELLSEYIVAVEIFQQAEAAVGIRTIKMRRAAEHDADAVKLLGIRENSLSRAEGHSLRAEAIQHFFTMCLVNIVKNRKLVHDTPS